jgi:hypothetical protein
LLFAFGFFYINFYFCSLGASIHFENPNVEVHQTFVDPIPLNPPLGYFSGTFIPPISSPPFCVLFVFCLSDLRARGRIKIENYSIYIFSDDIIPNVGELMLASFPQENKVNEGNW